MSVLTVSLFVVMAPSEFFKWSLLTLLIYLKVLDSLSHKYISKNFFIFLLTCCALWLQGKDLKICKIIVIIMYLFQNPFDPDTGCKCINSM
jgi:hypothetical protein